MIGGGYTLSDLSAGGGGAIMAIMGKTLLFHTLNFYEARKESKTFDRTRQQLRGILQLKLKKNYLYRKKNRGAS